MKLDLLAVYARFAVLEIDDGGLYDTAGEYKLYLNGKLICEKAISINYIDGLKPDTDYLLELRGTENASLEFRSKHEFVTLDVRKFGAKGDGQHDDTVHIQAALAACPPESRVFVPHGTYKITSLFLKSHVTLELDENAVLLADNERYDHPILPGMIQSYDETEEYNLGTWEGNPLKMFAGIITAIDVTDAVICGKGTINGNASHNDWWHDEKKMRGAFRPRLLFFERCKNISVYGINLMNSPAWTVHPYFTENLVLCALKITNPFNSPNTDGIDPESCKNAEISGIDFSLGDDCIAVKSGKIYMGKKMNTPSENIHIRRCRMQNGHGAVTLGSEMSAGVRGLVVKKCLFVNTDRGLRIKTRRGRGELSVVDNVIFRDIKMVDVKTPFVANSFYFCDPDGRTDYVQTRSPLPVDGRTPHIKKLVFENVTCENCHAAAAFFIGLPEKKIDEIVMRNIDISFSENAVPFVPAMLCGVGEMSRRGIIAENIGTLTLENVSVNGADGEVCELTNVDDLKGEVSCR